MATEEEIYKIIVQTQGEADIERLTTSIRKEQEAIRLLTAELRQGTISQAQFATGAKKAATSIAQSTQEIQKLQKATGGKGGGAVQGLTQLGYTIDDLQYGFKGIANNIQPLLGTIPKLARFAPVIAIAATAAYQLYEHWDQLSGLFGAGTTKTEAEQMEELKDKTEKTADETERLLKYERERKSLATQNSTTKRQDDIQGSLSEGLREVGHGKVESAIDQLYGGRIRNEVSDEKTTAARRAKGKLNDAQGRLDDLARQEPGQVTKHEFDQARKNRDRAQGDFNKALDAFNKEYGEKREKFKAQLATELNARGESEKLEKFISDATGKGLLSSKDAETLRNAHPDRQAEREAEKQDHKERMDLESRRAQYEEQQRQQEIARNTAGFQEKFSPAILNNIARGHANDPAALTASISGTLQAGGKSKAEAESIAGEIAYSILDQVAGRVRERSTQQGVGKEEAAAREAEDDAAAARSRAPKPKGAIGDASSFAHSLQAALFNKADPIQQAILDVNRLQADKLEKLIEETQKVRPRGKAVAVAAGPG